MVVLALVIGAALLLGGGLLYRHLTRTKAAEAEQKTQTVPDTATLYSFFWRQSAENADACFTLSFSAAETNAGADGHYLNGEFRAADGEFVECRDVPVPEERWRELEAALRRLSLPSYSPPDPHLLDATDSCVAIGWAENGNHFTNRYNGASAHELHAFLMTFIGQITA